MDFSKSAVTSQQIKNVKLRHHSLLNIWPGNGMVCMCLCVHLCSFVSSMWEIPKGILKKLVREKLVIVKKTHPVYRFSLGAKNFFSSS